ncbi:MAG: peroxiredoxin [Methylobacter sp.]|nr:peroxiredoxin [Methylobacter sp.]
MKRFLLTCLLSSAIMLPAAATLPEGHPAPDFQTQASLAGKAFTYSLKDALRKGPVVVYFYPSAYTGGCNIQAHTFAVNHDKFAAAGATIIGVSLDSIDRLKDFSAEPDYCAGKVAVASDVDGKIAKSYDLTVKEPAPGKKDTRGVEINHGFAERTTFIVKPDGNIFAAVGGLKAKENVDQALAAVQRLAAGQSSK